MSGVCLFWFSCFFSPALVPVYRHYLPYNQNVGYAVSISHQKRFQFMFFNRVPLIFHGILRMTLLYIKCHINLRALINI